MPAEQQLDICVNTQTPLLLFPAPSSSEGVASRPPETARLDQLQEGVDYTFSPGGVTRMVYPLLRRLHEDHFVGEAHWVSLNPFAPREVRMPAFTLHNVSIAADRLAAYGNVKETIWGTVHGLRRDAPDSADLFWSDDFSEYAYYNRITAEKIRGLDAEYDFDLFYIHDFQQLAIGEMLGTLKPKVYRWHIPFAATDIPSSWRGAMSSYLNSYDAVVVSTDRYLAQLKEFGYAGRVEKLYPFVDETEYTIPPADEVTATSARFGIRPEDRLIVVVGRMDPMKGQDRAIKALAKLARAHPDVRLLLVGNGSFSGSSGGLGLSKAGRWRAELEGLARELEIEGRVLFTGHVGQRELDACYERAEFTILSSVQEGFGLVVIESWIHGTPVIVSKRAGVAELVKHRKNALLYDPEDVEALAEAMELLLSDPRGLGRKLAENGAVTARLCTIDAAARAESVLLEGVVNG